MQEIAKTYKASAGNKKAKEVLLHNLQNILKVTSANVQKSLNELEGIRGQYRSIQAKFDANISEEKEHFKRIKEFEAAC